MGKIVRNSYFEKKEYRYIFEMYTEEPYLEPQHYTLTVPMGGMSMSQGNFLFDGQIFYREKKYGGNAPSGYSINANTGKK